MADPTADEYVEVDKEKRTPAENAVLWSTIFAAVAALAALGSGVADGFSIWNVVQESAAERAADRPYLSLTDAEIAPWDGSGNVTFEATLENLGVHPAQKVRWALAAYDEIGSRDFGAKRESMGNDFPPRVFEEISMGRQNTIRIAENSSATLFLLKFWYSDAIDGTDHSDQVTVYRWAGAVNGSADAKLYDATAEQRELAIEIASAQTWWEDPSDIQPLTTIVIDR